MSPAPGTDILEYASANRHLSPDQFGGQAVPEGDGLDGPLGSYGDPGPAAAYWQNGGVLPETGVGV
jgi:hypothetical protein